MRTSNSIDDLIERKIDFAFRIGELTDSQLTTLPLGELKILFCASPEYLNKHNELQLNNLIGDKHLLIPGFVTASTMNKLVNLDETGATSKTTKCHTSTDVHTLDTMAIAGLGITPTFDLTANDTIKEGRLVSLFEDKRMPKVKVSFVYQCRKNLPETMKRFKEFIKKGFPELLRSTPES